ncbi:extracellular solute-binding protein [Cloacibacillus porcorum]|nr:extracellular solute-binding protein [Cloacibacillus porcorum]
MGKGEIILNRKVMIGAAVAVVIIAVFAFTQMQPGKESAGKVDLNSLTVAELQKKAQEEGQVESVGMPDSWANWVGTWTDLKDKYSIEHADVDMSSAEELAIFEAEKENATKDIGDVGQSFGPLAESKGLTLPYKTSYWDEIPEWAKDDNGDWLIGYYGTIAVITNRKLVPNPPKSFADILEGEYMVTPGNVAQATQAQCALLAAAIANGGSETNLQPGFDFFRKLAEQGRIDMGEPNVARLEKGEIACYFVWDYNALGYRDQFKVNNPEAEYDVCIPADGSVQSGYATIINAYTKRPHAAAFTREYILSDAGQINLARGYATPIRGSVELPDDVKAKMLPSEQYAKARPISDFKAWEEAAKSLGTKWQEEVMAYAK